MNEHKVYELTEELEEEIDSLPAEEYLGILKPICSFCGKRYAFRLSEKESETLNKYRCYGRSLGKIQNLFPDVPTWIRSGAIDQYSDGFCICPECMN